MEKQIERRFSAKSGGNIEARAEGEGQTEVIAGYACMYDVITDMGWYFERVAKGACEGRESDDVIACFNHEEEMVMARTTGGTLELKSDDKGLHYQFDVPNLSYAKDLAENIRLKNVTQSSFAFIVAEETWDYDYKDGKALRTINKFERLFDVSPVVFPAYDTEELSVDMRSKYMAQVPSRQDADAWKKESEKRERDMVLRRIK